MASPLTLTGNDIVEIANKALMDGIVSVTKQQREEFVKWANSIAPVVTIYATLAAQGDPKAQEIMGHIRAQAETNLWILELNEEAAIAKTYGTMSSGVAVSVATALGSILAHFVSAGGLVLLGI